MEQTTLLHGFRLLRSRAFPELEGTLWEYRHEKTGAQLCWLERRDENKAFSIAFKTPPEDSTGVFHILEHSVLCGSQRYPVKEPFVELLKTSLQTFLNAMTYPDKTVFPVSSRNDQDFLNLIDVYLDGVLHPAIYHQPEIFRQEGWRFERDGDGALQYQGVVLNEMKGSFSAPGAVLSQQMNRLLFPDTCYRHVAGGDPACIPQLRYEDFLQAHRRHYHPSNAYVSLVGSVTLEPVLQKLDAYFSGFARWAADFDIPMQEPVSGFAAASYELGPQEPKEQRAILAHGQLLGRYDQQLRCFAAALLADYLAGDNDAPMKRAILDGGLGQDLVMGVQDGLQQPWFSWEVWNTEAGQQEEITRLLRQTAVDMLEQGLDQERLRACYSQLAFRLRDRDGGSLPRSLSEALELLDTWLYGGDPAAGLLVEPTLAALEKELDTDYFPRLLRQLFVEEGPTATVLLTPSRELGREKARQEAQRLAAATAGWTETDYAVLEREMEALLRWQQTPDTPEALASIPLLTLDDLPERPEPLELQESLLAGVPLLRHRLGSSLAHCKAHFSAADLSLAELPTLTLLCELLGTAATASYSGQRLQLLLKQHTGRLHFYPTVLPGRDSGHCRVFLTASLLCLPEEQRKALTLMAEILTRSRLEEGRLLDEVLSQLSLSAQLSLGENGHQYAATRVDAYQSAYGAAREYSGGVELVRWLKGSAAGDKAALAQQLRQLAARLCTRSRLTLSCSERVRPEALEGLLRALPQGEALSCDQAAYAPLGRRQEGLRIPAEVGFAAAAGDLHRCALRFGGSVPVLAGVLNYVYLWNEIRVQGGAYGCGFNGRDDGGLFCWTYRDPQPGRSLEILARSADFVRDFCREEPDLTGFILSAVAALDPLRTAGEKMAAAESRWFRGITEETACQRWQELLHTTPDDLLALCPALETLADGGVCVAAGEEQLSGCAALRQTLDV